MKRKEKKKAEWVDLYNDEIYNMKALLMIPATCRKYCYGKHASRCMLLLSTICIVFLAYVDAFRVSLAGRMLKRYCYQTRYSSVRLQLSMSTLPKDVAIDLSNIQLTRLIGTLDMTVDQQVIEESRQDYQRTSPQSMPVFDDLLDQCRQQDNRANIIRTFEARLKSSGNRVFIKEFLPLGLSFGRRELATIRGLSVKWNDICGMRNLVLTSNANYSNNNLDPQFSQDEQEVMMKQVNSWRLYRSPPFPTLLGTVRLPVEVVSPEYKEGWKQNVLRMNFNPTRAKLFAPPSPGSVWLIYSWDASSFQTLRRFPALPQVIEGLDYFNPTARNDKKWIFIRKIIAEALLAVDFLHRNGMVHNGINSNTMWLSTNTQQDYKKLTIFLSDLSLVQQNQEIGPQLLKDGIQEDLYQLGFVFLELVFASYVEDNNAASEARKRLRKFPSLFAHMSLFELF